MIGTAAKTLFSRFLFICVCIIMFVPFCIMLLVPERVRRNSFVVYWFIDWFYWFSIKAALFPIKFRGLKNLIHEPAIFVGNHQSSFDIPIMGLLAKGHPHIWLARHELMESCLLRVLLWGFAEVVDVTQPRKAMRTLLRVIAIAKAERTHIMIFPEGERHTDGKVHQFFAGFASIAKKTGRPVVPVRIFGIEKVYHREAFLVRHHPVTVVVGEQMRMRDDEDEKAFRDRVHAWFLDQKE